MSNQLLERRIDDVVVEFTNNNMVRIRSNTDRGKAVKVISFNDYCEAILASKREVKDYGEEEDSPIFPQDPLVSTIQTRKLTTGAVWYFITREAGRLDLQYYDTVYRNVGVPKLVFAVKLAKDKVQSVSVMATKDRMVTEKTALYKYPFSNVMGATGGICFGGNRLYEYEFTTPAHLHSLPNMFLSMPNNNDGYRDRNGSELELRPFLELLEGEDFPEDWLVPSEKTYGDWTSHFH